MPHKIEVLRTVREQRSFKIGIAIPCQRADRKFLGVCLEAVKKLDPQPHLVAININWNENVNLARQELFKVLFHKNCDVVLQNSVDFYLFPQILKYVKRNRIVSFAPLSKKPYDMTIALYRVLIPFGRSDCYSMPREYWKTHQYFDSWEGSKFWKRIGRFNYDFPINFLYYSLRPYKKSSVKKDLAKRSILSRFMWCFTRLGIG